MVIAVFTLVALSFIGISLYLVLLTAASFFFKKKADPKAAPLTLAIVIPAHNEALSIGNTIEAITRSRYPANSYRVIVIADNCQDDTATVAEQAGAQVLVRSDAARRGKGQALDWFLRERRDAYASCAGITIIDADTQVDGNFLQEVSASLSHPDVRVMQGYYGVSNATESWRTALMSAALAVFHHVRPAGRNSLGGSAGLKGNGMAFRTAVLEKYGWPAHSVVEDLEFGAQMLLDGICVQYNPDAVIGAEMAATRKQAETQRRRWEGGRFEIFGKYATALLGKFFTQRRFCFFDGFMDLLIPPLSLQVLALAALLIVSCWLAPFMYLPLALALAAVVVYVASGLALRKAPLAVWLYLIAAPFFILWKIPLYLKILTGGTDSEWIRTKRKAEMQQEPGDEISPTAGTTDRKSDGAK